MKTNHLAKIKRLKRPDDTGRPMFDLLAADYVVTHEGVLRSMDYMARNFRTPVQLKELVSKSGMSRRGLIKAFTKHTGQTPVAMLRQMRIEYARHLLETEDLPLKEIAQRTGFCSENTFCVAFHRAIGMAPKKYQRHTWLMTCRAVRQPIRSNRIASTDN